MNLSTFSLPHAYILQSEVRVLFSGIQNADTQAPKFGRHLAIYMAIFDITFHGITGIGQVFAEDGPTTGFAARFIVGSNKLPHMRPFCLATILSVAE